MVGAIELGVHLLCHVWLGLVLCLLENALLWLILCTMYRNWFLILHLVRSYIHYAREIICHLQLQTVFIIYSPLKSLVNVQCIVTWATNDWVLGSLVWFNLTCWDLRLHSKLAECCLVFIWSISRRILLLHVLHLRQTWYINFCLLLLLCQCFGHTITLIVYWPW